MSVITHGMSVITHGMSVITHGMSVITHGMSDFVDEEYSTFILLFVNALY
jgi:hypothetical protein